MNHTALIRDRDADADRPRRRADRARPGDRRRRPRPEHETRRAGDPGQARRAGGPVAQRRAARTMGMTCMSTIGGSSGPVFGTLLVTLAKELPAAAAAPADLARALDAGIKALTRLGKAEVGQKTLLDVLDPVQQMLARRRRRHRSRGCAHCAFDSAAGDRADGRDQGPRVVPRRARARPRRPGLALDGIDHRLDLRHALPERHSPAARCTP